MSNSSGTPQRDSQPSDLLREGPSHLIDNTINYPTNTRQRDRQPSNFVRNDSALLSNRNIPIGGNISDERQHRNIPIARNEPDTLMQTFSGPYESRRILNEGPVRYYDVPYHGSGFVNEQVSINGRTNSPGTRYPGNVTRGPIWGDVYDSPRVRFDDRIGVDQYLQQQW